MASTYVNNLRLNEMGTGDASGTWGTTTNTNLELIGEALGYGTEAITTNADTHTTTVADGASDAGRAMYLKYTGTLDSACTITIGPNTMKRMQFIENGTSGSQNIIISQGSGANITIPAGDVKAVYLDGAGSGAAVVDAFASLNVVDLKIQDDLTLTDDLIVNGDIDLEGAIDVNGTSNLDVVDIDGAVDMASTLTVAGVVDITDTTDSSDATGDTGALRTEGGASIAKKLYVGTDLDVDGTANLDVVDVDGAVDMASTLTVAGVVDITDTTDSSDATGDTGALRTEGGASIAKKLYVGTDLDVDGTANLDVTDIDSTLNVAGVVTAQVSANINQVAITSSSNATAWDAAAAANAYYVTSENTTISAPSNAVEGAIISVEIAQGGTARTVAWNTVFEFAASTAPTVTATASKTDIFAFRYNGSVWQEIGRSQNMAQT
jgi:cytoskeletal protein CcmA (bactofilin family)